MIMISTNNRNNKTVNRKIKLTTTTDNKLENEWPYFKADNRLVPNPEVSEQLRTKRRYTASYKLRILERADACKGDRNGMGRLLRSEGLYSSTVGKWRQAREAGILTGLTPKKRGIKAKEVIPLDRRVKELELNKLELEKRLELSQKIIEAQKKIAEIFTLVRQQAINEVES
jgi:transposase